MGKLTKRVENENAYLLYRIKIQKTLGFNWRKRFQGVYYKQLKDVQTNGGYLNMIHIDGCYYILRHV